MLPYSETAKDKQKEVEFTYTTEWSTTYPCVAHNNDMVNKLCNCLYTFGFGLLIGWIVSCCVWQYSMNNMKREAIEAGVAKYDSNKTFHFITKMEK